MSKAQAILTQIIRTELTNLYGSIDDKSIQIQATNKEFAGNYTLVVFPLIKYSKLNPEETAKTIAENLLSVSDIIASYNIVKGFLNLTLSETIWKSILKNIDDDDDYGQNHHQTQPLNIVIEYSSPNTNKPLHLGHVRNNLLGYSISRILTANGHQVTRVNLVNDRGIHICKSMVAWKHWGNNQAPLTTGIKGDRFVGDYYVMFDTEYKVQIANLISQGMDKDQATEQAPIIQEARQMLRDWENHDPNTIELWKTMNQWVYEGFDITYKQLGIEFDKTYYESETYMLGRQIITKHLKTNLLQQDADGSVWIDLTSEGLDRKLLLRKDGTSVYITQDIGTAIQRHNEYKFQKHIYVVGNEQNYHFQVLISILVKMGYTWANQLQHLSYGMVELPSGKMKSREGTVVDADDLIEEMILTAKNKAFESGKLTGISDKQIIQITQAVALGALKYFILKVDPKKNMLFNPEESIDFNGNTGPFIQYAYARIQSMLRTVKEQEAQPSITSYIFNEKEIRLIQIIDTFPTVIKEAGDQMNPAQIANYVYELAKEFNQYYHEYQILKESDDHIRSSRLLLIKNIGKVIKKAMWLLGIDVPDRM